MAEPHDSGPTSPTLASRACHQQTKETNPPVLNLYQFFKQSNQSQQQLQWLISQLHQQLDQLLQLNLHINAHNLLAEAKDLLIKTEKRSPQWQTIALEKLFNDIHMVLLTRQTIQQPTAPGGSGSPDAFAALELLCPLLGSNQLVSLLESGPHRSPLLWNHLPFETFCQLLKCLNDQQRLLIKEYINKNSSRFFMYKSDQRYWSYLQDQLGLDIASWALSGECLRCYVTDERFTPIPAAPFEASAAWVDALHTNSGFSEKNRDFLLQCIEINLLKSAKLRTHLSERLSLTDQQIKNLWFERAMVLHLEHCTNLLHQFGAQLPDTAKSRIELAEKMIPPSGSKCLSPRLIDRVFPELGLMHDLHNESMLLRLYKSCDVRLETVQPLATHWLGIYSKLRPCTLQKSLDRLIHHHRVNEILNLHKGFLALLVEHLRLGAQLRDEHLQSFKGTHQLILQALSPITVDMKAAAVLSVLHSLAKIDTRPEAPPREVDTSVVAFVIEALTDLDECKLLLNKLLTSPDCEDLRKWLLTREINPLYPRISSRYSWNDVLHGFCRKLSTPGTSAICDKFRAAVSASQSAPIKKIAFDQLQMNTTVKQGIYGRSYWRQRTDGTVERLKFRKRSAAGAESVNTLLREPSVLTFLREQQHTYRSDPKNGLPLLSRFPVPDRVYLLDNFEQWLNQSGLDSSAAAKLRKTVALEPDGSVFVYRFTDTDQLYHHYVHETEGVEGLGTAQSLEGLKIAMHDIGVLFRHGIYVNNTLPAFHDTGLERRYIALTNFINRPENGTLGDWNGAATDYPNIAPAPVGLRDFADISTVSELDHDLLYQGISFDKHAEQTDQAVALNTLAEVAIAADLLLARTVGTGLDYCNDEQVQTVAANIKTLYCTLFGQGFSIPVESMEKIAPDSLWLQSAREMAFWCSDQTTDHLDDVIHRKCVPQTLYPDHWEWIRKKSQTTQAQAGYLAATQAKAACKPLQSQQKGVGLGIGSTYPLTRLQSMKVLMLLTGLNSLYPALQNQQ